MSGLGGSMLCQLTDLWVQISGAFDAVVELEPCARGRTLRLRVRRPRGQGQKQQRVYVDQVDREGRIGTERLSIVSKKGVALEGVISKTSGT